MTQEEQARMQALEEKLACLESIIEHVSEGVILTDRIAASSNSTPPRNGWNICALPTCWEWSPGKLIRTPT